MKNFPKTTSVLITLLFSFLLITALALPAFAVSLDSGFNPTVYCSLHSIAVQADGKILIGTTCGIARLNTNGSLDTTFNTAVNNYVLAVAVQGDGRILIGGYFTTVNGTIRNHIARLNSDGSLDTSFNPDSNGDVYYIAVQADGKILIGGWFSAVGGTTRNNIARLNTDGSLDTVFNPNANNTVDSIVVQADGKILIGGGFYTLGGAARSRIARLNTDGSLDTSFNPNANGGVLSIAVQADGKILIGGQFTTIGVTARNYIARLNTDGSLDTSFNPVSNNWVDSMAIHGDGKILIGGYFTTIGGTTRNYIARLNTDGSLDASFNPNANNSVNSIAVQADGQILIGGLFTNIGGITRNYIARLYDAGSMTVQWTAGAQASANESGMMTVTAQLSAVSGLDVTVPFTVSGTATNGSDYTITASPITIPAGSTTGTTTITITPDTLYEGNETVILTMGTPTNAALGLPIAHTATITNDDTAPAVQWASASQASASESGTMTVTAQLSAAVGLAVTVPFTVTGTATGGSTDYTITASPITITAGNTTGTATITIIPDTTYEGNETVILTMGTPTNAALGAVTVHTATITDDDVAPLTVQWTSASQASVNESGTMTVTAQLSAVSGVNVTVPFTVTGTATGGGTDYTITASPITITAGNTTGTATITIIPDTTYEGSETVILTMGTPTNAALGAVTVHTATITDDDVAPLTVQWTSASQASANESGTMTVTAQLSAAYGSTVTVPYTVTGTATGGGTDYTITASPITITAGNTTGTATITIIPDTTYEGSETVILTMGTPTNAALGAVTVHTATITDVAAEATTLDSGFDPKANSTLRTIAVQGDGKILIGGYFTTVYGTGAPSATTRNRIARLNADGTLDTSFAPSADGAVHSIAVQGNGQILIGGDFLNIGGVARNRIARLNADGTLDTSFNPGADGSVRSIAVQGDGKIIIGGLFLHIGTTLRNRIARVDSGGALDAFDPNAGSDVYSIAVQGDGKILIGGLFTTVYGTGAASPTTRNRIARLNTDGTLDAFNINVNENYVHSIAVQPADGKIIIGGSFLNVGGAAHNRIARLNADGTVDASLSLNANSDVYSVAVQADGKILAGGLFTNLGGARNYVARLNADGTLDASFTPSASNYLIPIAVQGDGKILVGGNFTTIFGTSRNYIARMYDALPTVQWTAASQTSSNESGTMIVTAQLSSVSGVDVTAPFTVTGTATGGGTDYTITTSPITIAAGSTTGTATITITPDTIVEGNETVILTMGTPTNANLGSTTVHTATITDDDALPTVQWTASSQTSSNESGTMTVTAQLSSVSGVDVTVPFTVTGTATGGGTDYTITASPITITAGSTTGTATITITPDTLYEGNETVILTMGAPTNANLGATTVHTATITDDDTMPTVQWTAASQASINESGTMTVTAQLSAVSGVNVAVPYTVTGTATGGGTDYTITASPITITAGSTTGTATITITPDTLYEGNETVILTMGAPTNANLGATTVHTATITDDDTMPTVQWTSSSQASANESGTMTVTAQLSAVIGVNVTVPFTVTGTATNGTDYTITSSPVTISAGSTTGTATITVTPDALVEGAETVILTMGTPTNATLGATTAHTATITDDGDHPAIVIDFDTPATGSNMALLDAWGSHNPLLTPYGYITLIDDVNDPNCDYFTVGYCNYTSLSDQTGVPLGDSDMVAAGSVGNHLLSEIYGSGTLRSLNGGSGFNFDFDVGSVTFLYGSGYGEFYADVRDGAGNIINSFYQFNAGVGMPAGPVTLSGLGAKIRSFHFYDPGTYGGSNLTMLDNVQIVAFMPTVQWTSSSQTSANESGTMTVTAQLSSVYEFDVTVPFTVTGTATNGVDYSITPSPITIPAGNTTGTATITIIPDTLVEVNETVILAMGTPNYATLGATTVHTATIKDNDVIPAVQWTSSSQTSANESGTMTVTAQLSSVYEFDVTVPFTVTGTATNGTDYTITASPITILSGSTTGTATITITPDAIVESNETVILTMGAPTNSILGTTTAHTATIKDNDVIPAVQWTSSSQTSANESGTMTVTAQLSSVYEFDVTVPFTVTGTATNGVDYSITPSPITIPAGNTTGTATITIIPDTLVEVNETVILAMGTPNYATLGATTVHTATIKDNDSPYIDNGFDPNVNGPVFAIAVQGDGKTLIGGNFSTVGGVTRNSIARLNTDGSLDTSFDPNADRSVDAIAVQGDGKILIGGNFSTVGGVTRNSIARLNTDGSLDTSFDPNASPLVTSIAVQGDGKILIGGWFFTVGGVTRNHIARLNADGSLDTSFNPTANYDVYSIAVQGDGKILIGGNFTTVGGVTRNSIARLNSDGSLDASFNPNANTNSTVSSIAVQSDGKILIGGSFTTVGGITRNRIARLNTDGSLDTSFNPNANSTVSSIAVQSDGKILIGGQFTTIGGVTRNYMARLNADGSLDTLFDPNANSGVGEIVVQGDGKILIGGSFTSIFGVPRSYIVRVYDQPIYVVEWATASQASIIEGGTMTVTAQLSAASVVDVTVPFTVTGTATDGTDYTITASPITIPAGSTTGTATITIIDDVLAEGNETIILTMGTPTNATLGAITVHAAAITDDDGVHTVQWTSSRQASVIESGMMTVTAQLSSVSGLDVTVPFTVAGTATNGVDYTITASPITIPAGSTTGTAIITITSDTLVEGNETVILTMGAPTNASLGATTVHTATIADAWTIETVDSAGNVGTNDSIAVDSNNKVHISYRDITNGNLKYATNASGSWGMSPIGSTGGWYSSIATDTNNKVHISSGGGQLYYTTNASGSWVTSTIDSGGWAYEYTSIAIDTNNKVNISYAGKYDFWTTHIEFYYSLKYATNASGSWGMSPIGSTGGWYSSIATDTNNKVHISSGGGQLYYTTNASGSWVSSMIDSGGGWAYEYTSIAIDSNNNLHISYYDVTNGDLKYATNVSGSWVTSTIDSAGDVGQYTSIATDTNNNIHISYYDAGQYDLKYATNAPQLPTVQWTTASQASSNESGSMTVTAQLSAASGFNVTVPFTVAGTATGGGTDYTITASPITITAGSTTGTATITITPDTIVEGNETVILTMGTPTNAIIGATIEHTATITDDDAPPVADFTASPTSGGSPLTVNFTNNSTGYNQPLTYEWDFDNNGVVDSTLSNPSYEYTTEGTYSVKLKVTDSYGSANSLTRMNYITVTSSLPPVKIGGGANLYFNSIQAAYEASVNLDTILIQEGTFTENFLFGINNTITLIGGYDSNFTTVIGQTIINGNVTISDGVVQMENIKFQ